MVLGNKNENKLIDNAPASSRGMLPDSHESVSLEIMFMSVKKKEIGTSNQAPFK